jgi:hypothetical protein
MIKRLRKFFYCQILKGRTTQSNKVETLGSHSFKAAQIMYQGISCFINM